MAIASGGVYVVEVVSCVWSSENGVQNGSGQNGVVVACEASQFDFEMVLFRETGKSEDDVLLKIAMEL